MAKGEMRDKPTPPLARKPVTQPMSPKTRLVILICLFISCCLAAGILYVNNRWDELQDRYFTQIIEKEVEVEKIKWMEHIKMPTEKFIAHLKPSLDPDVAKKIADAVDVHSKEHQLPKKLILSVIFHESSFDLFAKSNAGAIGLMQVIPKYHKDKIRKIGITDNRHLYHIDNNINLGCMVWRTYYDAAKGDLDETFHSYLSKNASEETKNKYKGKILETWARLEFLEFKYENGKGKEHASTYKVSNGSQS